MAQITENENSVFDRQVAPEKPRSNKWKIRIVFAAIIFLILGVLIGNNLYKYWRVQKGLEAWVQWEKDTNAKALADAMADTYGGKTPYETLSLYIKAVKKGDYELASKYFIAKYHDKEFKSFEGVAKDKIDKYISDMEQVLANISTGQGSYDPEKTGYAIENPVLIDFTKYPNGVWKIIEI